MNLCDCSPEQLAELLRNFYIDVRKKDGTSYKLSALKSIRFGLSRHFSRELEIDIIHDPLFKRANEVFHAVTVDMKRKGLAKVDHTPPIEPEDLKQMYCSVALNPNTPVGLQQKVWFDVMFFLCRRGRENLRTMTTTSFSMKTDRTGTYVYQAQDELDKNHRESADPLESNTDGRKYEVPGTIFTNIILNM